MVLKYIIMQDARNAAVFILLIFLRGGVETGIKVMHRCMLGACERSMGKEGLPAHSHPKKITSS